MLVGREEHVTALRLVSRYHHYQIGQAAQVTEVKCALMGGAVCADDTCTIDGQSHIEFLDSNIMNQLVVGALQKRRIDGHDRFETFARQSAGKGDCVLFRNTDVEIAIGVLLGELHQS